MRKACLFRVILIGIVAAFLFVACGKSAYEQAKELYGKGYYEQAIPLLEKAKEERDHFVEVEDMIRQAKVKLEEQAEQDCLRRAESFVTVLSEAKTVEAWDKVLHELKTFKCRKLSTKPYVDRAFFRFVSYLAQWDAYPQAVAKYCEFFGCEASEPHVLIREEEIAVMGEDGKETEETIQQEIPIAQHDIAVKMFGWLLTKDIKNARWFDRYAKFLYDNERFKDAQEAYQAISEAKGVGYEIKSRAQLTVEHLKSGKHRKAKTPEMARFFWIEDVKTKSKLKALRRDLEKAQKEKEMAEEAKKALGGTK